MSLDLMDPRKYGRKMCKESVDPEIWHTNEAFTQRLIANLAKHPLSEHPIKEFFENETISKDKTHLLHLEFGYGFAQIFTDAVIAAMARSADLENRLGPKGKVTARFLWALNLQDELGYFPSGSESSYKGHPYSAHYYQYVDLFNSLGSDMNGISLHEPTKESKACRASFEDSYHDYQLISTVLALSESIFDRYAGAWGKNVQKSTGIDTSIGYHTIHGEDDHGDSIDDDHSEDGWTLVRQALEPKRHAEIESKCKDWMDAWYHYADKMIEIASK